MSNHLPLLLDQIIKTQDYSSEYASFLLPFDPEIQEEAKELSRILETFDDIAIIAIGGSNLGTLAIHDALGDVAQGKKMYFFDTTDTEYTLSILLKEIEVSLIYRRKLVLTIISKSGTTTETIALASTIYAHLFPRYKDQIAIVTISDKDSKLYALAEQEGWYQLTIPTNVGGRYSVFSEVGIFPLTFVGYDTDILLEGARSAINDFIQSPEEHLAHLVANRIFSEFPQRNLFHHWFFAKKFENLGKWYRQLMAESIGKKRGTIDSVGITPTVSIGTIDLHSVAQLEIAHDRDRSVAIIEEVGGDEHIVGDSPFLSILPDVGGKKFGTIMRSGAEGFRQALMKQNIPVFNYKISTQDPYDIGYWMQTKMIEAALLGELFGINPFNQPNVEDYKSIMREQISL